jgi:dipeptidyl aminopeptidase/acylaminoacyl peptidase
VFGRVGLLCALVATGISAADAGTHPSAPELSFSVRLHGNVAKAAICVAPTPGLRPARRMTRLAMESTGAWSPDGRALAVADGDPPRGGIRVVDADGRGGRLATQPRANELDSAPTWSPDGTRIAFSRYVFFGRHVDYGRAGVWVATLGAHGERQISKRFAGSLDWSPDGGLIAADVGGELNTEVQLLRPSGGLEQSIRVGEIAFEHGVSWSPDGRRLAVGGGVVIDRNGNEVGRYAPLSGNDVVVNSPAWSPDGESVAYVRARSWSNARTNVRVHGNGDLYLGSVDGRAPVRLTATARIDETTPAWRAMAGAAGKPQPCMLTGTPGGEVLRGTRLDDLIDARGGDDTVYGAGGNDFVAGGAGRDVLVGGPGRDWLWGETGNDRFLARDRERDSILGGAGRDRARVDRGLDAVMGVEDVSYARSASRRSRLVSGHSFSRS